VKRREFITLLGGAAAAWPRAARAQQAGKLPTIGFLGSSTLSEASPWVSAFVERLRELGWTEGRNVAMAFRWAGGRSERYSEIATEFVGLKVDVILVNGGFQLTHMVCESFDFFGHSPNVGEIVFELFWRAPVCLFAFSIQLARPNTGRRGSVTSVAPPLPRGAG
jgi:hypothetical protein